MVADLPKRHRDTFREIAGLSTLPEQRGQGKARWLMCKLCAEADQAGIWLMLVAEPFGDSAPMDADKLRAWYERLGFELQDRHNNVMARQPRETN